MAYYRVDYADCGSLYCRSHNHLVCGPTAVQIVIFFIVSICLLVFTRKIFVEKLKTGSQKTNVDALIGERAIVEAAIPAYGVGQVKVGSQVWSAVCEKPDKEIEAGKLVKIHAIEGVKVIVVPVKEHAD